MKFYSGSTLNKFQNLGTSLNCIYFFVSLLVVIVIIQTGQFPYQAGTGDHHVIFPAGLLRADPSLYQDDYFVRNAVMPHWFYEYIVTFASKFKILNFVLFGLWILTIFVFSWANLLIAKTVITSNPHFVAFILTTTQVLGARSLYGTAAIIQEQALPHTSAAALAFLTLALWLKGDRKILYAILPVIPLFHIQVGIIAIGFVFLLSIHAIIIGEKVPRYAKFAIFLSGLTSFVSLLIRPVAGNTSEFATICARLLPHHCFAPSWSKQAHYLVILFIIIGISALVFAVGFNVSRTYLYIVLGVPLLVLTITYAVDRYGISPFAEFFRGNNLYRFVAVIYPFIYWTPIFIWRGQSPRMIKQIFAVLSAGLLFALLLLEGFGSRFSESPGLLLWVIGATSICYTIMTAVSRLQLRQSAALIGLFAVIVFGIRVHAPHSFALPNIRLISSEQRRDFAAVLRTIIPKSELLVGNPTSYWLRMDSGIGYAVDCKFRPIGGGQALKEFYKRLDPIGGYEKACLTNSFSTATALELTDFAETSMGRYLLVPSDDSRITELESLGWKDLLNTDLLYLGHTVLEDICNTDLCNRAPRVD